MLKSKFVHFFAGAVVVVAAAAVAAVAAPDAVAPAVAKVKQWAKPAPSTATVRGQLRLEGEPLAFTRIEFHTSKGLFVANTDAGGLYEVRGLPAGEARISIHTFEQPSAPEVTPEAPKAGEGSDYPEVVEPVKLPTHYRNNQTSGLTANLQVGEQWQNFNMTAR